MTEAKCVICLDVLSTKKTVVFKICRHEHCLLCVDALVLHLEPDPPYVVKCPICNEEHVLWQELDEIVHDVINLMHDPIDLTNDVIDSTQAKE